MRWRNSLRVLLLFGLALLNLGWSSETCTRVGWTAVDFLPPDLAEEIRENHRRFDAGIRKALGAPPTWRTGPPGHLQDALVQTAASCRRDLRKPIPLADLVEELGILSVLALEANDPLAVADTDPREPHYAAAYRAYVSSILDRVRLVYYGWDPLLNPRGPGVAQLASAAFDRSGHYYPFVGREFYKTGRLGNWREFDDRSIAFGVAAVSLSRGMTDFINLCRWIWRSGGGLVPTPRPTPVGHQGPVIIPVPSLEKGFDDLKKEPKGAPAMPRVRLSLPPP